MKIYGSNLPSNIFQGPDCLGQYEQEIDRQRVRPPMYWQQQQQKEYDRALQERFEIERQIESLSLNGVPKMGGEYLGKPSRQAFPSSINSQGGFMSESFDNYLSQSIRLNAASMSPPTSNIPKYAHSTNMDRGSSAQIKFNPHYGLAKPLSPAANNNYFDGRPKYATPRVPGGGNTFYGNAPASVAPGVPGIKVRGQRNVSPSGHTMVYQVQFKRGIRYYVPGPRCPPLLAVGEFVITQCSRGENLGVVTEILTMQQLQQRRSEARLNGEEMEEGGEGILSQIVRLAGRLECQSLPAKHADEQAVFELTVDLALNKYHLNMHVVDCEYQFDRTRLTISYACEDRVDFRELVKELCAKLKIRIWMKQVTPLCPYSLSENASLALATGFYQEP